MIASSAPVRSSNGVHKRTHDNASPAASCLLLSVGGCSASRPLPACCVSRAHSRQRCSAQMALGSSASRGGATVQPANGSAASPSALTRGYASVAFPRQRDGGVERVHPHLAK